MQKRMGRLGLASLVALGLTMASQVQAGPMPMTAAIDFGVLPNFGSITYAGGANPLIGTNIIVSLVSGVNTPLNPTDPLDMTTAETCVGCMLNFTTGNLVTSGVGSATFSGGGSITITGGVDLTGDHDANDPGDIPVGTTLLSGTFNSVTLTLAGTTVKVLIPLFGDRKNPDLIDFYGMPTGPYAGFANIGFFSTSGIPPAAFSSTTILSGDVVNSPVSVPSSILLIGSGLIGFAYLHFRQRRI